ncbi:MAG: glycosyltransferase family 4 protein, partial [Thermoanaerobaculia bacterium]
LKGVAVLVAALERLMDRLPDLRMLFIGKDAPMGDGEGTGVEFIRERLGRFGDRVLRLDRMPHSQLYPFLSRARGSVLPSLVDNLPNAAIEAMLFGRVLIGTRGASFEELIEDEKSGLLVEIGDVPGLAMAMERLWGMSALERDAIGALARESAQRFSAERTIPALESYFREVVAGEIRN